MCVLWKVWCGPSWKASEFASVGILSFPVEWAVHSMVPGSQVLTQPGFLGFWSPSCKVPQQSSPCHALP